MSILDSHSVLCADVERLERSGARRVEVAGCFSVAIDETGSPDPDTVAILDFGAIDEVAASEPWTTRLAWMKILVERAAKESCREPRRGDHLGTFASEIILAMFSDAWQAEVAA